MLNISRINPVKKSRALLNITTSALVFSLVSGTAFAAITAEEAAKLGAELTPVGANPKGNAAGTIPPWTGGLRTPPAGYVAGSGDYVDPFADEKPLYVITAANMGEYDEFLTAGTKALLQRFPETYKVPVYPTHRTAAFSDEYYKEIKHEAQRVELVDDNEGTANIGTGALPFPIPKNGAEVITNLAHGKAPLEDVVMTYSNFPVQSNGSFTEVKAQQTVMWSPRVEGTNEITQKVYYELFSPASNAGYKLITYEPSNFAKTSRQTWAYNPGQRRVLRAPDVSYDTPIAGSDGLVTNDATDCFTGGKDRYDWELVGKREIIAPYNNYKLNSMQVKVADIVGKQHVNPDLMRYELHRAWVVEATLKEGKRNVFGKRTFYFDEDSYRCLGVDMYDGRNELWRVVVPSVMQHYDIPIILGRLETHYDLQARRYQVQYVANESGPYKMNTGKKASDFSLSTLRRSGR